MGFTADAQSLFEYLILERRWLKDILMKYVVEETDLWKHAAWLLVAYVVEDMPNYILSIKQWC